MAANRANRARRTTKKLRGGKQPRERIPPVLILAGCCGMVVVAVWAPVARAQLILSAVALIAVCVRTPDK
jgi:Flp pilus assembly protein TadB